MLRLRHHRHLGSGFAWLLKQQHATLHVQKVLVLLVLDAIRYQEEIAQYCIRYIFVTSQCLPNPVLKSKPKLLRPGCTICCTDVQTRYKDYRDYHLHV